MGGAWINVTPKKMCQFINLHRFSLCYSRPVKIIPNVKRLAKLLIILLCTILQSLNATLSTYLQKIKSEFWSRFFLVHPITVWYLC